MEVILDMPITEAERHIAIDMIVEKKQKKRYPEEDPYKVTDNAGEE